MDAVLLLLLLGSILLVTGMTCGSCVQSIEDMIGARPGVQSITVSLAGETADISFNPQHENAQSLCEAIDDMVLEVKSAAVVPVSGQYYC